MNRNPQLFPKRHLCLSRIRHEVLLPLIPSRRAEWSRSSIPAAWSVEMGRVGAWPWDNAAPHTPGNALLQGPGTQPAPQPCSLSPIRLPAVISTITATSFWIASPCLWETEQGVCILLHSQPFLPEYLLDIVGFLFRWSYLYKERRSPVCCYNLQLGLQSKDVILFVCF